MIDPPNVWQQNHGNLLLAFVGVIILVGGSILAYRQNRFVPVGFPDGNAIQTPLSADGTPGDTAFIKVSGAANSKGSIRIAIYGAEKGFNDPAQALLLQSLDIVEGEAVWELGIEKLPETFAVAAYHDENGDEELNRNRLGIPTERYGFSRNARGLTGPPEYADVLLDRPVAKQSIQIFVR